MLSYQGTVVPPSILYGKTPVVNAAVVGLNNCMLEANDLVANETAIELTVARVYAYAISNTIVNKLLVDMPAKFSK